MEESDRIHEELGKLVKFHIPDTVVAFTSGSLPYGAAVRGRSDIDVNVLLPTGTRPDRALFDRLICFIDDYSRLHDRHGMCLDRRYPGEYLTIGQAHDAASGRGIPVINGRPALLGQVDDSYWNTTEETWYLAWMGASAFSRRVAGDSDVLMGLRRQAWATVAALCLPDLTGREFHTEDVLARVLDHTHPNGGFGVHPGYRRFAELELYSCRQALADLAARSVLKSHADGSYCADPKGILRWVTDLVDRRQTGFHASPLLTVTSSLQLAR
ncbi:hypothetical protein RKE29_26265 [Streptomyces sp. B1866]|uniref:hypothetical protein n=1 Tax=Streptomyces sp. B1866 TaxID=3075431 RepID=UPI002890EBEF|nr:hypothetical protein [Streptomyces sp. B1866]MDT3400089.1 hypothetical protein [Streptomyces sp. B1866]